MTVTKVQVRIMMRERRKGRSQEQAGAAANVKSRQTVAKYEQAGWVGTEAGPRRHRTRPDPFEADWGTVVEMLGRAPELEAKAVFEWLCAEQPGRYQEGQLRTFQRHVAQWRGLHVEQVAVLEQVHRPGEVLETDGTWLNELGLTVQGEPFEAVLIHSVLVYSNWEWGVVARSESLGALQLGLQQALRQLGAVPQYHQTDHSTAATYRLGAAAQAESGERWGYTQGYLALLSHYGLEPRTIHVGRPGENGDVESANGGLKRALAQHLLLRGNREFESISACEVFIQGVMRQRNQRRQVRLTEELGVMKALSAQQLVDYQIVRVRVTRGSLIRVGKNLYSVPTSLIGEMVSVYVYEWTLAVYYGQHLVERLPRLSGTHHHQINYRHVIDSLLRKPGGFRDYRYRDDLFPRLIFRQAWEQLNHWYAPRKADLIYLRVLALAARTLETEVVCALELLVASQSRWDETDVEQLLQPQPIPIPQVSLPPVSLTAYDHLLAEVGYELA